MIRVYDSMHGEVTSSCTIRTSGVVQARWCIVTEMAMGAPPIASPVLGVSLRIAKLNGITVRYAEAGCPTNPMVLFW
jgi:hypothetical protein